VSGSREVTVGIDIGTTSVKAVAVDADGTVAARTRIPHQMQSPGAGAFEHDIDQAWRTNVIEALAQVSAGLEVAAVNVSAMVPSLGAVDGHGRGISPGLLYGDHRGITETNRPDEAGDSGELLAFLGWLTEHAPDAAGYWPAQAVANHALCGEGAIDSTTAMTAVPLFDYVGWDSAQAAAAGTTPDRLPVVVGGVAPAGRVLDGLPAAGALVGGGTIDALGEQVVAGADGEGDVLVICGATLITWAVVAAEQAGPAPAGLWSVPHTAPGKLLLGGPSNAGGIFVDRVHRWLSVAPSAVLDDVDVTDLPIWLPYVRGERTPLHRRDLRAELHGAAIHHEVAHLRRAVYEAAGFVVRHHLDLAATAGAEPRRIVATGGGSQSVAWMQAMADATGLPVDVVAVPEGAALGSAFMARCTAGLERSDSPFGANMTDARRWARTARRIDPDEASALHVDERYQRFRELTDIAVSSAR
jgi:xylulokinase